MHLDGTAERDVHVHFNLIQLDVFLLLPSTPLLSYLHLQGFWRKLGDMGLLGITAPGKAVVVESTRK